MKLGTLLLALVSAPLVLFGACTYQVPTYEPVPANDSIVNSATPLATPDELLVVCDGPEDEVAFLGFVCGARAWNVSAHLLHDVEFGNLITVGDFSFYAMGSHNDVANLSYEAFFQGEPVSEGRVHATTAVGGTCGTTFRGSAEFLWRNTTIRMNIAGSSPC